MAQPKYSPTTLDECHAHIKRLKLKAIGQPWNATDARSLNYIKQYLKEMGAVLPKASDSLVGDHGH